MPYKLYPEVSGLALPRDLSLARVPMLEALAAGDAAGKSGELSLEALTRILFCADGLTIKEALFRSRHRAHCHRDCFAALATTTRRGM